MKKAPQRDSLWQTIVRGLRTTGRFPAPHQLGTTQGISESRVRQLLGDLERHGLIERRGLGVGRAPILGLTPTGIVRAGLGVPVIGAIQGGAPGESALEPISYFRLPSKPGRFALRVAGDSMAEAILDGDYVFLEPNPDPPNGRVCAVRVGHGDATLKRFYRRGDQARLEANNPSFAPITANLEDIRIEGVMVGLLRGDVAELVGVEANTV